MGSQFWDFNRKSMVSKIKVVYSFKSLPSPLMSSRGLESSFFAGTERGTLTNGDLSYKYKFAYKRITSTQFSELLSCLLFLKNNQFKLMKMPKRHIWGSIFCSPP